MNSILHSTLIFTTFYQYQFDYLPHWIDSIHSFFLPEQPKFFIFFSDKTKLLNDFILNRKFPAHYDFIVFPIHLQSQPFHTLYIPLHLTKFFNYLMLERREEMEEIKKQNFYFIPSDIHFLSSFENHLSHPNSIYSFFDSSSTNIQLDIPFFGGNIQTFLEFLKQYIPKYHQYQLQDSFDNSFLSSTLHSYFLQHPHLFQFFHIPHHIPISHPTSIPSRFLYIKTYGGLGNILFQICTGISMAIQYHYTPIVLYNKEHKKEYDAPTYRDSVCRYPLFNPIYRISKKEIQPMSIYKESGPLYEENIHTWMNEHKQEDKICIDGYFQTTPYFESQWDSICKYFSFSCREISKLILTSFYQSFTFQPYSIGIHIRGGDYLKHKDYHLNLPKSYYTQAIEKTLQKENSIYILFTDDIPYAESLQLFDSKNVYSIQNIVKEHIPKEYEFLIGNDELELFLFAEMKTMICANSSFSLFASYFSEADKIYIPHRWIVPQHPYIHIPHFIFSSKSYEILSF